SSAVSNPTRRFGSVTGSNPRTSDKTVARSSGESLHAQPAPCEKAVSRTVWVTAAGYCDLPPAPKAYGLRPRRSDVVGPADARVVHELPGLGRLDHRPAADVEADMVDRAPEEHEVAGFECALRYMGEFRILRRGVVAHRDAAGRPRHHRE